MYRDVEKNFSNIYRGEVEPSDFESRHKKILRYTVRGLHIVFCYQKLSNKWENLSRLTILDERIDKDSGNNCRYFDENISFYYHWIRLFAHGQQGL